jgi:hypothetical protein
MPILITFILVVAVAACLAGVLSHLMSSRHHRPTWYIIPVVAFLVGLFATVVLFRHDLFRASSWENDKIDLSSVVSAWFLVMSFVAIWPSWLVVRFYRGRFGEVKDVA